MTEETARTKWCPMVRFNGGFNEATFNRGDEDTMNCPEINDTCVPRCIASDCMMWRGEYPTYTGYATAQGYCGLAGKL